MVCLAGLPVTHGFMCLLHVRNEIHPLQDCPMCGVDSKNWLLRSVFTLLNFVLLSETLCYTTAWKSGNVSPSLDTGTTQRGCDLGRNDMLLAQLYTLHFQALWFAGSENKNTECQICVMKRNWKSRILLQTVTAKAWSLKLNSYDYFAWIKKSLLTMCFFLLE